MIHPADVYGPINLLVDSALWPREQPRQQFNHELGLLLITGQRCMYVHDVTHSSPWEFILYNYTWDKFQANVAQITFEMRCRFSATATINIMTMSPSSGILSVVRHA